MSILAITAAACGNSDDGDDTSPTTSGETDGSDVTAAGEEDRDTFVSISGVPGVTDEEISYAAIGTLTNNPLGTCLFECYVDGVKAYFAYRNSEGGIFGRDLVLGQELDDALGNNQAKSLEVASGDDAFGAFQATLLATGWGDLDTAGVPTYAWGIHATEAANRPHVFPSLPIRCGDCTGRAVPFAVKEIGAKHVAALGYGDSENSKDCTRTIAASIELYSDDIGGAEVAYVNEDLPFGGLGERIGPIVTAMKDADVDFIATCVDSNGMKTIADELARQGMDDVVLSHPNSYDAAFVAESGDLFEGDFVGVQYMPFEADTEGTAMADFIEWLDEEGREPNELSMAGWLNATLAFEGLLAAGPEFDRDKVTAATNAMTEFDAGGILQPIDWTAAHEPYTQATRDVDQSGECTVLVRI